MNIQHLESLNDQVWQMTGVRVRETIPDWVVRQADEIVMVDVTPRALLHRLERGVVYAPEKAQQAMENFFRESTLVALRELALRETAHEVEHRADPVPASARERLLVLVTAEPTAAMVIRRARRVADFTGAECFAVAVVPAGRFTRDGAASELCPQSAHRNTRAPRPRYSNAFTRFRRSEPDYPDLCFKAAEEGVRDSSGPGPKNRCSVSQYAGGHCFGAARGRQSVTGCVPSVLVKTHDFPTASEVAYDSDRAVSRRCPPTVASSKDRTCRDTSARRPVARTSVDRPDTGHLPV